MKIWCAGPHGEHVCLVFEVLGKNLLHVIQEYNYRGLPLDMVRQITRQVRARAPCVTARPLRHDA
jgi:hypothetical protein